MLITVILMLFKLEDKKELHGEVFSLNGVPWGVLTDNVPSLIPQPIDLFCHTIFLAKFIMLTSFSPHFFANIEG